MKKLLMTLLITASVMSLAVTLHAQNAGSASIPRWLQFSGVLRAERSAVSGLTFGLYKDQEGGAPLWIETQNVAVDEQGRYTVLLGSATTDGLPLDLFASGEARWLGVTLAGRDGLELPRILLVSVPYALEAANAKTLGGIPLSSFLLKESNDSATSEADGGAGTVSGDEPVDSLTGTGNSGRIAKFTGPDTIADAIIVENAGKIGIGTASPEATLDVSGPALFNQYMGMRVSNLPVRPYAGDLLWSWTGGMVFDTGGVGRGIAFNTNDNTKMWIDDNSGRITIGQGVATGGSKLSVRGNLSLGTNFVNSAAPNDGLIVEGNVGIGKNNPTERLDVTGNMKASGSASAAQLLSTVATGTPPLVVASTTMVPNLNANFLGNVPAGSLASRGIVYLAGCDTCSTLVDADSQKNIYYNVLGAMSVVSVTCFSDAGNPTINIRRDDGTPAKVLSGDLVCSPTGATSSVIAGGEGVLNLNEKLDFEMVAAGVSTKRITVAIKTTLN